MSIVRKIFAVLLGISVFLSCEKEGRTIFVEIEEEASENRDMVFFVSKKGSLGDISYVDEIYRGVVKGAGDCNLMVSVVDLPADTASTISTIQYLLDYMQTEKKDRKALVVMANDNLEPILHKYESLLTRASNVDLLLCESGDTTLPVYTLRLPQYGVYYQAGMVARDFLSDTGAIEIVNANQTETNIADMGNAFRQALMDCGSEIVMKESWLTGTSGGYDKADITYQMSYSLDKTCDMVIPLCGGSSQGFYRYNRENPESFYTVGVDADMQLYSPRVPFSVVKHMDSVLEDWITAWWSDEQETPERHLDLGLASGYTEIVVADDYKDSLEGIAEMYYDLALQKEEDYEKE